MSVNVFFKESSMLVGEPVFVKFIWTFMIIFGHVFKDLVPSNAQLKEFV